MTNPFSNIISANLKQTYKDAIDAILAQNALTVPCTLKYSNSANNILCNNCIFDPISKTSSSLYNQVGPSPFPDHTICPVCLGMGVTKNSVEEIIHMAVIFDSKYFLNWSSKTMNIPAGAVQTICSISLIDKIKDANEVVFNNNISNLGNYIYQRAGSPEPCGLGDHNYIITMWVKK
jgi:hypothetical protein